MVWGWNAMESRQEYGQEGVGGKWKWQRVDEISRSRRVTSTHSVRVCVCACAGRTGPSGGRHGTGEVARLPVQEDYLTYLSSLVRRRLYQVRYLILYGLLVPKVIMGGTQRKTQAQKRIVSTRWAASDTVRSRTHARHWEHPLPRPQKSLDSSTLG
jgi:hypothetical protein